MSVRGQTLSISLSPTRASRRRWKSVAVTAAVGATALFGGTVSPAQADTGHFTDATGDAYAWTSNGPRYDNPEADIVRYELSVTDAAVSASVFLSTWDRSRLDTELRRCGDRHEPATPCRSPSFAKYAREDGDPSAGLTALFRVVDVTQDGSYDLDVVDCAVLFGFSSATHGVSLSSPASCLGSPASARVSVVVATGYDGPGSRGRGPRRDRRLQPRGAGERSPTSPHRWPSTGSGALRSPMRTSSRPTRTRPGRVYDTRSELATTRASRSARSSPTGGVPGGPSSRCTGSTRPGSSRTSSRGIRRRRPAIVTARPQLDL